MSSKTCYFCGETNQDALQDHHILPRAFGVSSETITLCASCHVKLHKVIAKFEELMLRHYALNLERIVRKLDSSGFIPEVRRVCFSGCDPACSDYARCPFKIVR